MPEKPKKGARILVVEGAQQGKRGIVTQVQRVYDEEAGGMRWMVWAEDVDGGERIKTRLNWVRELAPVEK